MQLAVCNYLAEALGYNYEVEQLPDYSGRHGSTTYAVVTDATMGEVLAEVLNNPPGEGILPEVKAIQHDSLGRRIVLY